MLFRGILIWYTYQQMTVSKDKQISRQVRDDRSERASFCVGNGLNV